MNSNERENPFKIKARIVIADDDPENISLVEQALKSEGHQTRACANGEEALHMVRSWAPHVVLLDVNMPKMSGTECLKKIRALSGGEYIGVVLVTANSDLQEIISGLDSGADDYIIKPYRIDELRARVRACLRTKILHDTLRRANKRLEEISNIDELTSLRNMRFTLKKFDEEVAIAKQRSQPISCVMFDIDHFKEVNDKHDHLFGSHVLREVGQLVLSAIRSGDIAARYGGDEFFLVFPNTKIQEAFECAERMRKMIEAYTFRSGNYSVRITASFGVSGCLDNQDYSKLDARELVRSADSALYGAKGNGRNRTEVFNFI